MTQETVLDKARVFDWLLQRHVHEYMDVDGRPIGEGRSQAYAQVETKFKSCPYAGSRYHHAHPMNVSALQSILPEWQNSLSLLSWLSQRYRAFYHKPVSTYYDLALISGMGVFLTDYMALRQSQPLVSHHIPVWMSGLYKVCLGFQQATFLAMMNDCFKSSDAEKTLPDGKGFYAYLEDQQLLIGEAEVCGGSEEMISRAYETMTGQYSSPETRDHLPQLAAMDIDWDAYDAFTFHTSNLWRKAILFVIQMRDFGIELHDPSLPAGLLDAINAYLKDSFAKLLGAQSGLAVEIARLTLEESGRSLEEWLTVQAGFLSEIDCQPECDASADELSGAIMQQLAQVFDLSKHQQTIACAVNEQLARYEAFEAAVLQAFNDHLGHILVALGHDHFGDALTSADLSSVYGKTVRNWPEIMRQE
jgi:hypothetical protein